MNPKNENSADDPQFEHDACGVGLVANQEVAEESCK